MKSNHTEHLETLRTMHRAGLTRDDAINAMAGKMSVYWIRARWYELRREVVVPPPPALIYMDVTPKIRLELV